MMKKNTLLFATVLALATAIISGTNNFLTKVVVDKVNDPIVFTFIKNTLVFVMLLGSLCFYKKWNEIKKLSRRQIIFLIAIGVIGGSIPFALYFTGLTKTSAVNASLIHKTLFLWVMIFAIPFLREKISWIQGLGSAIIFSAVILLIPGFQGFRFDVGELMILSATILWAIENIIAKKILQKVSSILVAGFRMGIGSVMLFFYLFFQGKTSLIVDITLHELSGIILTTLLLFGYVLTWYTALKYAEASYVSALLVPSVFITAMLSAVFTTHTVTMRQAGGAGLTVIGIMLVIYFAQMKSSKLKIKSCNPKFKVSG